MKNSKEQFIPENNAGQESKEASEKLIIKCAYCGRGWDLGAGEWRTCMGGRDSNRKKFKEHESNPVYVGVKKSGEVINNYGGDFDYFRRAFER